MADDASNDDQWLYGDSIADTAKDDINDQSAPVEPAPGTEGTSFSVIPPAKVLLPITAPGRAGHIPAFVYMLFSLYLVM